MKPGKAATSTDIINFARERIAGFKDAEIGGLHGRAAAQSVGQDFAAESSRSVLGGEGSAGEISALPSNGTPYVLFNRGQAGAKRSVLFVLFHLYLLTWSHSMQ